MIGQKVCRSPPQFKDAGYISARLLGMEAREGQEKTNE